MALEDPQLLRDKNRKRLRDVINLTFILGINVTAPSPSKDLLRIITIILIIASCGDVYGHVCYILRFKDIVIIAESICTMFQTIISILKLSYFLFVQSRFYELLRLVATHELIDKIQFLSQEKTYTRNLRKEARQILDDCWRFAKAQFNFYIACVAIISCYYLNVLIVNAFNWSIGNTNHTNSLPYPVLFPLWENKMNELPYYAILAFIDLSALFIAAIGAVSFDGIFIIKTQHGVALFRILRKMIAFTTSSSVPKKLRLNYLQQCINHQERTFQYCRDVNNLYLHMSLVQFLMSLVILGVVMFQASVGLENNAMTVIKMGLYLVAALFQVVIYCLNGQLITNESDALTHAWYACNWYDESREFKQLIRLMIMRSNRVFYMRASWFSTMSLPTLMVLIKTSGSYFLLLRNLSTE